MNRLIEEIQGRVAEAGSIVARNLEFGHRYPIARFVFAVEDDGTAVLEFESESVIGDLNGCYKDPPGVCCECPCD